MALWHVGKYTYIYHNYIRKIIIAESWFVALPSAVVMSCSAMIVVALCVLAAVSDAQYLRTANVSVLQVYPPLNDSNTTDGTIPLYFALMQSFGGSYTSAGVIPGIQVALDEINANHSVLPGYSLHYYLTDTQV